ncbi:hypothetical protein CHH70_20010 [Shouchella clausii]|jgi:hypothetical protein|nr:hypothetical protein WZ76_15725 [Shouchella clausii]PAD14419.1 hypothetical protein CHH73_17585 [Shouchella clausii]PAD45072.1 hypothetical protein CHI09_19320 [Shouchella clausii]PAE91156.1 hypothetical protein CHH70_20010 [Shouchella clausii]PAF08338.1 hypothetical protein CHH65_16560 [Shouchella clausii]
MKSIDGNSPFLYYESCMNFIHQSARTGMTPVDEERANRTFGGFPPAACDSRKLLSKQWGDLLHKNKSSTQQIQRVGARLPLQVDAPTAGGYEKYVWNCWVHRK